MSGEKLVEKMIDAPLSRLFLLFIVFIVVACPGALWLAMFKTTYFSSLDNTKMLLLSAAISIPVFIINMAAGILLWFAEFGDVRHPEVAEVSGVEGTTPNNVDDLLETAIVIGGVASFLPLYIPLLIRLFIPTFSIHTAVITLLGVELVAFVILLYAAWKIVSGRFWEEREAVKKLRAERKAKSVLETNEPRA